MEETPGRASLEKLGCRTPPQLHAGGVGRQQQQQLTQSYRSNSLCANPDKTQVTAFHLRNKEANGSLKVEWNRPKLENTPHPKYLGVTLDRTLSYKEHMHNKDEGGHPQQSTKKVVQFEMGSKRKYHKNNSIGIMLFCG